MCTWEVYWFPFTENTFSAASLTQQTLPAHPGQHTGPTGHWGFLAVSQLCSHGRLVGNYSNTVNGQVRTYDGSRLGCFNEGQSAVISLLGNIDWAVSEFVFLQNLVQLAEHAYPLVPLALTLCEHQDRTPAVGRRELRSRDLGQFNQPVLETDPALAADAGGPGSGQQNAHSSGDTFTGAQRSLLLMGRVTSLRLRIQDKAKVADTGTIRLAS